MEQLGIFNPMKNIHFRRIFNGLCAAILFFYFYKGDPLLTQPSPVHNHWLHSNDSHDGYVIIRRNTMEISDNSSHFVHVSTENEPKFCDGFLDPDNFITPCEFLQAHPECSTGGLFDYLRFFYCKCYRVGVLGYAVLGVWLAALFYLLGNTAADYFCSSLEKLSEILKLPPTVAGVTLLPLGNGAPDVFASIAAFVGTGVGEVGLNSMLGAAVFVTCVVVGTVSLLVAKKRVHIDRKCFIRDITFFFVAILALLLILVVGKVSVGAAVAFLMIYVLYAFVVAANEMLKFDSLTPLLPVKGGSTIVSQPSVEEDVIYNSLLESVDSENDPAHSSLHLTLPQWMWASSLAIYSSIHSSIESERAPIEPEGKSVFSCPKLFAFLDLPLSIPRRLTIPTVEEETWSRPYAIASVTLAPTLIAFLWIKFENPHKTSKEVAYITALSSGCMFGILAHRYTTSDHPPRTFLLPWLLGGFTMSIVWFYMIATELVALLVALGIILGTDPSILGLTVLAWGNSMGDLVSNVALALNGGDGVQIALSGCYAGPMFNTLIGLGMSLLLGALSARPHSLVIPEDRSLFCTIGFLLTGLVWAVVVLLCKGMRPNRTLGVGLISLYLVFLSVRIVNAANVNG